jgi:capsular polysaccharide biosynthesis protein
MTQVEVPQISLQRYFDLLKRRRWQVIPVSLLGLLVGGLVAVFIPRYYVADTLLVHEKVPGQADPRNPEDPFRAIVETAKLTIPLAVGETMVALKWPEGLVTDASQRTQNERAVRYRLFVDDGNRGNTKRDYAQITVQYRDQDAQRAASFLNTLVATWIDKRLRELRAPAEADLKDATERVTNLRNLSERYTEEKKQIAVLYEIDASLQEPLLQYTLQQEQQRLKAELRTKVERAERELESVKRQLQLDRDLQLRTEARVVPDARLLLAEVKDSPEGKKALLLLDRYEEILRNFRPGSMQHKQATRGIEEQRQKLQELVGTSKVDADGMVPNPEYVVLLARIEQAERQRLTLQTEFDTLATQLAAETSRVERRAIGFSEFEQKRAQCETAKTDLESAIEDLRKATAVIASLGKQQTVTQVGIAQPPPRPTEPNILVVALLGCVLGLGVAIGLILLLDIVQGTFKTLDDVERAVPVPVLGGMSHLETDAEREEGVRRRRRVSVTAAAFVTLVVVVVTIFYVDPTRLPPVVRDLLAMLLGS